MSKTNIIQQRDLNPLWAKATEVIRYYEKASNSIAAVIGPDCVAVEYSKHPKAILFCLLCKRYNRSNGKLAEHEHPCTTMHREAVRKACRSGGSYIYTCSLGFFFWTSPFFSGERFAGALTSSGMLAIEKQKTVDRIFETCRGEISLAEIAHYLEDIPEKSIEDIKALAQMMLLCAEKISSRNSYWGNWAEYGDGYSYLDYQTNFSDQERLLIASLRRGDGVEARNIVWKLLDSLNVASNGNFDYFKLRVIGLVVLLSRTGVNLKNSEEPIETNNRYFKRIEDSKTVEEINENMGIILEQMAGKLFSFQGVRHASALRKAERFIWENYTRKISLKEIADISGLSAPYFSTVFKDEMGENLFNYLNRLRVEKAVLMLQETEFSINKISAACGFKDQSWFSKIFKTYTGFSPCKYREHGGTVNAEQTYDNRQVSLQ